MLKTFKTKLVTRTQLNHDTYLFRFEYLNGENLEFQPGQYLIVHVPQGNGDHKRRLLSIVTIPQDKTHFELLLQLIPGGILSEYLRSASLGAEILFTGPAGIFILRESSRDKVFIATGTGIAPIKSMILSEFRVSSSEFRVSLFWGMRYLRDMYFLDEFKKLKEQNPNFDFKICLSAEEKVEEEYFAKGRAHLVLEKLLDTKNWKLENSDFYICGGRDVVEFLRNYLYDKGVPKNYVFFEKF